MPDSSFFCPELFDFLRQLKRHNNRDWFAKNKQRYEEAVRDPALLFISSFGPHLHKLSPHFVADADSAAGKKRHEFNEHRTSLSWPQIFFRPEPHVLLIGKSIELIATGTGRVAGRTARQETLLPGRDGFPAKARSDPMTNQMQ
jgi:hypothetical protein